MISNIQLTSCNYCSKNAATHSDKAKCIWHIFFQVSYIHPSLLNVTCYDSKGEVVSQRSDPTSELETSCVVIVHIIYQRWKPSDLTDKKLPPENENGKSKKT
uniref:Uncharacterized protein n=1 Tax=Arion vulgaris TaxID=1028688 RepID=A0A0B6YRA9_9EUPU